MTPYQLFKNKKPTLNFLHVFGCKCYILRNQTDQNGKFDAKADEGIFVGYAVGKAYRVYNLRTNIVVESIHVVFDDKKIEGLKDGDYHESLKFDNVEMVSDESDDESDQETVSKDNADKSTTNEAQNSTSVELHNASSVGRQSVLSVGRQPASSVGTQNSPSVGLSKGAGSQGRSPIESTPISNQRSTNSGGVSSNQNSITHQDNIEVSSSRANLPVIPSELTMRFTEGGLNVNLKTFSSF